ncbi:MAG: hypothetical protein WCO56_03155 [Verrucomicrobiota bacterium]
MNTPRAPYWLATALAGRLRWVLIFWMFLMGAVTDQFGWTASFLVAASLSFAGSLAWLFVNPDVPIPTPDKLAK